jgi:hypothetical protein
LLLSVFVACRELVSCRPEVQLEYKYVVKSTDGGVLCWKPGENCQIKVPVWLREEKAIAEGVLVRDAWDGSIQDIELEVTGFQRTEFTEDEERAAVQSAVSHLALTACGMKQMVLSICDVAGLAVLQQGQQHAGMCGFCVLVLACRCAAAAASVTCQDALQHRVPALCCCCVLMSSYVLGVAVGLSWH